MAMGMSGWNRVKMITGGRKIKKETENLGDYWTYPGSGQNLGNRENSEVSAQIVQALGGMARNWRGKVG